VRRTGRRRPRRPLPRRSGRGEGWRHRRGPPNSLGRGCEWERSCDWRKTDGLPAVPPLTQTKNPDPPPFSQSGVHEVNGSIFRGRAFPVASVAEAKDFVSRAKDASAGHNVYAWIINGMARCVDDGEPSGTAGRPILALLEARRLDGILVHVTRHRQGPRLGRGGLYRGYGAGAAAALAGATFVPFRTKDPSVRLRAIIPAFAVGEAIGPLFAALAAAGHVGDAVSQTMTDDMGLVVTVDGVEAESADELVRSLRAATRGRLLEIGRIDEAADEAADNNDEGSNGETARELFAAESASEVDDLLAELMDGKQG